MSSKPEQIVGEGIEEALPDMSTKEEQREIDPAVERSLVRKLDKRLVPTLFILYICAFIDRVNIGNARIQGLEADLGMKGNDYNTALYALFVPYILLEVPSNLLLKKLRPSIYLPALVAGWGLITICQGLTKSYGGLVACRVLIGTFEAGYFPGMVYLTSMFYKRTELQKRLNIMYSACILAGAFSGLLAYAISRMDGRAGLSGWRWIFILEGIATILIAFGAMFILPDWIRTCKFLSEGEKVLLEERLARDVGDSCRMDHWNKKAARRVFGDIKIWLGGLMFLGITTSIYNFAFFMPTILKQLGWTSVKAQVMTIPVYLVATILAISTAVVSDRLGHRFTFIIIGICILTVGYAIMLSMFSVAVGVRYFALYACVSGGFMAHPLTVGWLSNNVSGHYKRGVGAAVQVAIGNVGGIIASNIFISGEAPKYKTGFGTGLGLCWFSGLMATVLAIYMTFENRARARGARDHRYQLPEDERQNLGDDHPSFRFML